MAKERMVKKHNKVAFLSIAIIILLIAAVVFFLGRRGASATINDKMVMADINYESVSKASFHADGKYIFYAAKDGMRLIDKQGTKVWEDPFTMQQPVLASAGAYAAVAEERGRIVRVYGTEGLIYEINAEGPITTFSINKSGYVAVVMEMANEYITNIYNSEGSVVSLSNCPASESIPVAVAISEDSGIYATSYIDTTGVTFRSNVVMRYIGKDRAANAETIDGMFTSFSGGSGIVGMLDFYSGSGLVALSDKELIFVDVASDGNGCTEKMRVPMSDIMTSVGFADNGSAVIAFRAGGEGVKGKLRCYNKDGKETAAFDTDEEINYIKAYSNLFIAVSGSKITAYDYSGNTIWQVSTLQDVKQALMFASQDELIIAGSSRLRTLKIKKGDNITEAVDVQDELTPEIVTQEITEEETVVETEAAETTETTTEAAVEQYDDEDYSDDDEEYYSDEDDEEYYEDDDEEYYSDDDEEYYDEDYEEDYDEDYDYSEDEE